MHGRYGARGGFSDEIDVKAFGTTRLAVNYTDARGTKVVVDYYIQFADCASDCLHFFHTATK
jgi:hypothetical protein